jgi:excisionase family DNA binding protein
MLEQYITPQEVADRLKVPRRTVMDWIYVGKLPAIKAGKVWRVKEADVVAFIEASTQKPTPRVGTPKAERLERAERSARAERLERS